MALACSALEGQSPTSADPVRSTEGMEYFFHRPEVEYGSAAVWGPLGLLANRGLSILQFEDRSRDLQDVAWGGGLDATLDALLHPKAAVRRAGGWKAFLRREFVPSDWEVWTWAWAPNYAGHLLGGGISHRQLTEWFDHRGLRFPGFAAGVWYYGTMIVNETIENAAGPPGPAGTVADLYLLDPLGMLLFSFDGVAGFFAHTLEAGDWSPQVGLAPPLRVLNNSQVIAYKFPLPFTDRARLLFLAGQGSAGGAAIRVGREHTVSGAVGFGVREREVDPVTGAERITPRVGGGLYLDRNGSLLVSATLTGAGRLEVNVYPGVLPGPFGRLGVWGGVSSEGRPSFGFTTLRSWGLGLGIGG